MAIHHLPHQVVRITLGLLFRLIFIFTFLRISRKAITRASLKTLAVSFSNEALLMKERRVTNLFLSEILEGVQGFRRNYPGLLQPDTGGGVSVESVIGAL